MVSVRLPEVLATDPEVREPLVRFNPLVRLASS